jgi:ribosomal protein L37AE/L43A
MCNKCDSKNLMPISQYLVKCANCRNMQVKPEYEVKVKK